MLLLLILFPPDERVPINPPNHSLGVLPQFIRTQIIHDWVGTLAQSETQRCYRVEPLVGGRELLLERTVNEEASDRSVAENKRNENQR